MAALATVLDPEPAAHVALLPHRVIDAMWPGEQIQRHVNWRPRGSDTTWVVEHDPVFGYRLRSREQGTYLLSETGGRIICAPRYDEFGSWRRCRLDDVLAVAAFLSGWEVLYASAVIVNGDAYAFAGGPPGLHAELAERLATHGAELLTNEPALVGLLGSRPIIRHGYTLAHAGADESPLIVPWETTAGDGVAGEHAVGVLQVDDDARAALLRRLYVLTRAAGDGLQLERIDRGSEEVVRESNFVPFISPGMPRRIGSRAMRTLAREGRIFRMPVVTAGDPAELVSRLEAHLHSQDRRGPATLVR